jgi:hypothetical protein
MKDDINLLPKQIVIGRERRAYLFGFGRLLQRVAFLLVAIILGEAIIYGAYYYVDYTLERSWNSQIQSMNATSEAQSMNDLLTLVDITRKQFVSWSLYSEEVLNSAPREITISRLEVKEKLGVLEVDGYTSRRSSVLEYKNILAGLSWVDQVEAPLQNYAIGPDSGFSFSLVTVNK